MQHNRDAKYLIPIGMNNVNVDKVFFLDVRSGAVKSIEPGFVFSDAVPPAAAASPLTASSSAAAQGRCCCGTSSAASRR